jgi:hypothetical protein
MSDLFDHIFSSFVLSSFVFCFFVLLSFVLFMKIIWAAHIILARPGVQIILLNPDRDNKIAAHLDQEAKRAKMGKRGKNVFLFFLPIFAFFASLTP